VNQPKIRFSSVPSSTLTMGVACKEVPIKLAIANYKKKRKKTMQENT